MTTTTTLGAATLIGAVLATAMSSGLMFCFAHSVMPVLARWTTAAPELRDAADLRSRLDGRWVRWNMVRAVTSTGALSTLSWALFVAGRAAG